MATLPLRFAVLLGSSRVNPNNSGVAAWVMSRLKSVLSTKPANAPSFDPSAETPVRLIDLTTYPLPLGPLIDDLVPQSLKGEPLPDGTFAYPYPAQRDRDFSAVIQSLDGLVVVTPQYNWGYPGELKNTFDHIFPEWTGLPIAVVTYGGRGGGRCAEAMKLLLSGILAENVSCGEVQVILPGEKIRGSERVSQNDDFLKQYEEKLDGELGKLIEAAARRQEVKTVAQTEAVGGKIG